MTRPFSFLGSHFESTSDLHLDVARLFYRDAALEDLRALERDRGAVDRDYARIRDVMRHEAGREDAGDGERATLEVFDRADFADAIDKVVDDRIAF